MGSPLVNSIHASDVVFMYNHTIAVVFTINVTLTP